MKNHTPSKPMTLRAWRKARHYSQAEAAQLFGITQSKWSRIERGQPPEPVLMKRLVHLTDVPVEVLAGIA